MRSSFVLLVCCLLACLSVSVAVVNAEPLSTSNSARATDPAGFHVPEGFEVELLYSVPLETQGSWVSMTSDPQGRLIVCDQNGHLYRATPSPLGTAGIDKLERIDVTLGGAQGLLYAFDALYVVVNQTRDYTSGLYRVSDTDGDDQFDTVEALAALQGGGEHGPHGIVLTPDGKSFYIIAGNNTSLPTNISNYRLPSTWQEDQLLKRNPSSVGHNTGVLAPGGWVCRVSPDGKEWELISAGFRNPYDIAVNSAGDAFTFDADMEHDLGAPWYRPTRVCQVASGAEFGWRFGTGKWPSYSADSLPAVLDVGLGSPTGVAFGYGAKFPPKYADALYVCDWTHGRLFALHLQPDGGTYSAEIEEFLSGTPLPLTDIVVNPVDQAMYFTIGGRQTQSGLYRVTWNGPAPIEATPVKTVSVSTDLHQLRSDLEQLHTSSSTKESLDFIWNNLGHEDRFVRYAARIALEHLEPELWRSRVFEATEPETTITGLLALARTINSANQEILSKAISLWSNPLSDRRQTDLLRALAINFARHGRPSAEQCNQLLQTLEDRYPASSNSLNYELCQMLVYLDSTTVVSKTLKLMTLSHSQEELLNYAMSLRVAKTGWTDELRTDYLTQLKQADEKVLAGDFVGGGHLQMYLQQMRDDAAETMTEEEKLQYASLLNPKVGASSQVGSPTPRKFIKRWTVDDLAPHLDEVSTNRSYENGKRLFQEASCRSCHRFNNQGGVLGPDLTAVAKRYSRQVLLREVLTPSMQVSDQFQTHNILTDSGKVYSGRILNRGESHWRVAVDPKHPAAVVQIPANEIEDAVPSTVSMMPTNLLDTLTKNDILDLFAYLESGGDPDYKAFRK